jgi:hypothetical protein
MHRLGRSGPHRFLWGRLWLRRLDGGLLDLTLLDLTLLTLTLLTLRLV